MKHRVDRQQLRIELFKRGWHPNSYGAIECLEGKTEQQMSDDYFAAIEASIICEPDDRKGDFDLRDERPTKRNEIN